MTSSDLSAAPSAQAVLDQLFAQDLVGLGILDADGRYVRVNDALAAMNGVPAAAHPGRTPRDVLGDAIAMAVEPLVNEALGGTPLTRLEFTAPDGRGFAASYLPVAGGGVAALVVETTSGRRAEAALRRSQERLQLALEGTQTGTFEYELATDEVRWSENLGVIWGRERGWHPPDYESYLATLHPEDRDDLVADVRRAATEGTGYQREHRILWPDGQVRWVHSRVHVVRDGNRRPAVLVGLTADVTERRLRELGAEFLSRASLALAESLDVRDTLQRVAEFAVPQLGDWCVVHLRDDHGETERVAVAHADPARAPLVAELQERYPPDPAAPTGVPAVLRDGRSELYPLIDDAVLVQAAEDEEHLAKLRALGLRSVLIVPMVARGRTLGAISFAFTATGRMYSTADLELAEELGRRAGLALDNARLHAAERAAHRQVEELLAVTDVALSHLELDDLLVELLMRVRDAMGGDLAAAFLEEEEGRRGLRVRAAVGEGDRTVLELPLRAGGEKIGILRLAAEGERDFDEDAIRLLDRVADRAARAIAHARVYDQARNTSDVLQRSLLPSSLPAVAGLEVAVRYVAGQKGSEVGGDWYDVVALRDGRVAVTVGDVMGRGVAAAAGMGSLRASLRAYAYDSAGPADAVARLDELVDAIGDIDFATLALATIDPERGEGHLCLAGHPPPLLRRAGGRIERVDGPAGLPIGAPVRPRTQSALALDVGDLLLLYTDGLVERRGTDIRVRIGELEAAVGSGPGAPEALLDHLIATLTGGDAEDDMALLALRRVAV